MTIEKIEKRICDRCGFTEVGTADLGGRARARRRSYREVPVRVQVLEMPKPALARFSCLRSNSSI